MWFYQFKNSTLWIEIRLHVYCKQMKPLRSLKIFISFSYSMAHNIPMISISYVCYNISIIFIWFCVRIYQHKNWKFIFRWKHTHQTHSSFVQMRWKFLIIFFVLFLLSSLVLSVIFFYNFSKLRCALTIIHAIS